MIFRGPTVDLGPCARRSFEGRRDTKSRWLEEPHEKPSFACGFELIFGRDRLRCVAGRAVANAEVDAGTVPSHLETVVGDRDASKDHFDAKWHFLEAGEIKLSEEIDYTRTKARGGCQK